MADAKEAAACRKKPPEHKRSFLLLLDDIVAPLVTSGGGGWLRLQNAGTQNPKEPLKSRRKTKKVLLKMRMWQNILEEK